MGASHDVVVTCPLATAGALTSLSGSGSGGLVPASSLPTLHWPLQPTHTDIVITDIKLSGDVIMKYSYLSLYMLQVSHSSLRFEAVNKLLLNVMHSIPHTIPTAENICCKF